MKLQEAAAKKITRVAYVKDRRPVWNKYSFADIAVFDDGTIGPWLTIYDPCGNLACGIDAWKPLPILSFPTSIQISVGPEDEFEEFVPPADMNRFPGCPPVPKIILRPAPAT